VDYPSLEEEKKILSSTAKDEPQEMTKVPLREGIVNLQKLVRNVPVGEYVVDYVARLVRATTPEIPQLAGFVRRMVDWGAGPARASSSFAAARRCRPWMAVSAWPSRHSRRSRLPGVRHRISTNFQPQAEGVSTGI